MKLSQCITFTAIAATLPSTQTAAAKIGRPKADKASTQDQYETVLVQAKADKASYEKVIRSPTYAATPYPDSKFIDNPIWAKAGKGGRNLDRYGTAILVSDSKAGKGGRNINQYADRYVSQPEEAGANSFWPWNPTQLGEDCFFPTPTCASGLRCTAYVSSGRLRGDRWYDDTFQGQPGKCVYLGTNGKDTPGYPVLRRN